MMTILLILGNVSINDSNNDTLSEKLLSDYEPEEMQLELEAVEPMAEEQQNHLEAQKENPGHLEPEEKQQIHLELPEPIAAEEAEVCLKVAVNSYIDDANNETSSDDEDKHEPAGMGAEFGKPGLAMDELCSARPQQIWDERQKLKLKKLVVDHQIAFIQ